LKEFNKPFNSLLIQDNNGKSNYKGNSQKNSIAFKELSEDKFGRELMSITLKSDYFA
jgi:hypothetical protein